MPAPHPIISNEDLVEYVEEEQVGSHVARMGMSPPQWSLYWLKWLLEVTGKRKQAWFCWGADWPCPSHCETERVLFLSPTQWVASWSGSYPHTELIVKNEGFWKAVKPPQTSNLPWWEYLYHGNYKSGLVYSGAFIFSPDAILPAYHWPQSEHWLQI